MTLIFWNEWMLSLELFWISILFLNLYFCYKQLWYLDICNKSQSKIIYIKSMYYMAIEDSGPFQRILRSLFAHVLCTSCYLSYMLLHMMQAYRVQIPNVTFLNIQWNNIIEFHISQCIVLDLPPFISTFRQQANISTSCTKDWYLTFMSFILLNAMPFI